ncbi:hypothetical protein [Mycolicibacter senuensis]|uniref:Ferredoxin n=1 Tax=Mycolicibacter senuensis TaxID=386913 RepID=A0A7I9XN95_9MYCO|nr:hypothetical protein [Mycolicibacter senuensis]MDQ2627587.1 hypothetical protein [Actinomycetota bacterium]ORW66121.1 hypothetical protein AWC24_15845 [Mycolicibacter senuensis]GFG71399.1 hypothetical protein MSEN_31190 [Mycolicibacter senuensis]
MIGDERLNDAPMRPVTCRSCGAKVLARKSSWEQTSVQWSGPATDRCLERRQTPEHSAIDGTALRPGVFVVCARLRASIDAAVSTGALPVLHER